MEQKSILITGGAGFIGTSLVSSLVQRDADVHVLDNLSKGDADRLPEGIMVHKVDIRSDEVLDLFEKYSINSVVHLAALHHLPYCKEHPTEVFDINVMGTRNVLRAAANSPDTSQIVFASSAAIYGTHEDPIVEDTDLDPMNIYGETKLIGEKLVFAFHDQYDLDSSILRLFNVYGAHDPTPHLIPTIINQLHSNSHTIELGNLTPRRDFVYIRDVVRAFQMVLNHRQPGVCTYNVGTGTSHSVREVVETVEDIWNTEINIVSNDDRTRSKDPYCLHADISKITDSVGWEPRFTLRDGLQEMRSD
jgi:UDP-glucose 4-epimerase